MVFITNVQAKRFFNSTGENTTSLRHTLENLQKENNIIDLYTPIQLRQIEKAIKKGKGLEIIYRPSQIKKIQKLYNKKNVDSKFGGNLDSPITDSKKIKFGEKLFNNKKLNNILELGYKTYIEPTFDKPNTKTKYNDTIKKLMLLSVATEPTILHKLNELEKIKDNDIENFVYSIFNNRTDAHYKNNNMKQGKGVLDTIYKTLKKGLLKVFEISYNIVKNTTLDIWQKIKSSVDDPTKLLSSLGAIALATITGGPQSGLALLSKELTSVLADSLLKSIKTEVVNQLGDNVATQIINKVIDVASDVNKVKNIYDKIDTVLTSDTVKNAVIGELPNDIMIGNGTDFKSLVENFLKNKNK